MNRSSLVLCLALISVASACLVRLDVTGVNQVASIQIGTNSYDTTGAAFSNYRTNSRLYGSGDHIAIEVRRNGAIPSGFLASITVVDDTNKVYVSSANWKCSRTLATGWKDRGFDDSAWANATVYGSNGDTAWGGAVLGISTSAKWVWASGGNTANPETVYCRFKSFCPARMDGRQPVSQSVCQQPSNLVVGGGLVVNPVVPPQKILVLSVRPTVYEAWTNEMVSQLRRLISSKYTTSSLTYQALDSGTTLPPLAQFTQIWVYDLSYTGDTTAGHQAQFRQIAAWFNSRSGQELIVDGRILSENYGNTARYEVFENYFANLAIRGGGLMLGTDHDQYSVNSINIVNDNIGIAQFWGNKPGPTCTADTQSPLMTWPNYAPITYGGKSGVLMDHTSTGITPFNIQSNGQILYPLCWHNDGGVPNYREPAISSTIRGSVGFRVTISNPACDLIITAGTSVNFNSTVNGYTGQGKLFYSWHSNLFGDFSYAAQTTWTPPVGRNVIRLSVLDDTGLIADYWTIVTVTYRSQNTECFTSELNGGQPIEIFPVFGGAASAVSYYNLNNNNANTPNMIEKELPQSSNLFLYTNNGGALSLINIMSAPSGQTSFNFAITSTGLNGAATQLALINNPGDTHTTWTAATGSGRSNYSWTSNTKGWVITGLPNTEGSSFCIEVDYNQVNHFNMKSTALWLLPTEDKAKAPQYMGFEVSRSDKIKLCRKRCRCPALETFSGLTGSFASTKSFTSDNYDDTVTCSINIQPTSVGGPVAGITFVFNTFNVAKNDVLTAYQGTSAGTVVGAYDSTPPTSIKVDGGQATFVFKPTNDGKAATGWSIRYTVIPTVTSGSPANLGFSKAGNVLTLDGANFVNSASLKVYMDGTLLTGHTFVSGTRITVPIPIQPPTMIGKAVTIRVTNDGLNFANWTGLRFIDLECGNQTTCLGCAANPRCNWCNDLSTPAGSFCFDKTVQSLCTDKVKNNKIDDTCCSQCVTKNFCSTPNGTCNCDLTCKCDNSHWGADCSCLKCPVGAGGLQCSGRGTCGCNGVCACPSWASGPECGFCSNCTIIRPPIDPIPTVVPPQRVLFLCVGPTKLTTCSTIVSNLNAVLSQKYATSSLISQDMTSTSTLPSGLETFTQVWVYDRADAGSETANHKAQYSRIVNWFKSRAMGEVIFDGRLTYEISSTTEPTRAQRTALLENYFANLGVRGGGLVLATDEQGSDQFTPRWTSVNEVNMALGYSIFWGSGLPKSCTSDADSPLMKWPNRMESTLKADGLPALAPSGLQVNGWITYPVCSSGTSAMITSTIRGTAGNLLVTFTKPTANSFIPSGTPVNVEVAITRGVGPYTYIIGSSTGGILAKGTENTGPISWSWTPTPGQHILNITVRDSAGNFAQAWTTVTSTFRSNNTEGYIVQWNNKAVWEIFPVVRIALPGMTAVEYYGLRGDANTPTGIEKAIPASSNFFLYKDYNGEISLMHIISNNSMTSTYSFSIESPSVAAKGTRLQLVDDTGDLHTTWNTATGMGKSEFLSTAGTTKGWIISDFPNGRGKTFCVEMKFNPATTRGIATTALWGMATDTSNNQPPQYWAAPTSTVTSIKICRAVLGCPTLDTFTASTGTHSPPLVAFGPNGSTNAYDDTKNCNIRIQPTPQGGPVSGISIFFEAWDVKNGDNLVVYTGPANNGTKLTTLSSSTTVPAPLLVKGGIADLSFQPNNDGNAGTGWKLRYVVQPTITNISGTQFGFSKANNIVVLNGANFFFNEKFKVVLNMPNGTNYPVTITELTSPSIMDVRLPVFDGSMIGQQATLMVTNDGVNWVKAPLPITFVDVECGNQVTCLGCSANPKCNWCNELNNASKSFCFDKTAGDAYCGTKVTKPKVDSGCCSQCVSTNYCNNQGTCNCNLTCACNSDRWGLSCECKKCPVGSNGQTCSGRGTCGCGGACSCTTAGAWGADCGCKACGGSPTCSGRGTCQCDGTCLCNARVTNKVANVSICDCPLDCPSNCNGRGTCNCGKCENCINSDGALCERIAICGDRKIEFQEKCDDGNSVSGDGCSSSCQVEQGWKCGVAGQACASICGDGIIRAQEQCDDGNLDNGDGCSGGCAIEEGWTCSAVTNINLVFANATGSQCCRDFPDVFDGVAGDGEFLCAGGWWVFDGEGADETGAFTIRGNRDPDSDEVLEGDTLILNDDFYTAGDLIIDGIVVIVDNADLGVAGTITIINGGGLIARNGGTVWVADNPLTSDNDGEDVQLSIDDTSFIGVDEFVEEIDDDTLRMRDTVAFSVEGCVAIEGYVRVTGSNLDNGESELPLLESESDCIMQRNDDNGNRWEEVEEEEPAFEDQVTPDLPHCTSVGNRVRMMKQNKHIILELHRKNLCPGQIAGIVVGSVVGAACLLALLALLSGGLPLAKAADDAYVAL